eukprot:28174-Eustigmatos_ZCMA.PRE.1
MEPFYSIHPIVSSRAVHARYSPYKCDSDTHPDLFWASCGGGGGTFGITTSFEYTIHRLPNNGR